MSQSLFWNLFSKKLVGEASPEELLELEKLMKQNPHLIYQADILQKFWNQEQVQDAYDTELAFESHLNRINESGIFLPELDAPYSQNNLEAEKSSSKKKWALFASLIIILLVGGFMLLNQTGKNEGLAAAKSYGEVSTKPGSKSKLILPDSTIVWLNAGSKFTYSKDFGVTNRNTTLIGEAFFDVKKSTIPFIIHANSVQIKVLGTAFNVKSYPNEKTTETSLIRGRVEITLDKRPGEKFILKPNEKLTVINEPEEEIKKNGPRKKTSIVELGNLTHTPDSSIIETSWVENKLIFQDESFADVAKKLERWYGVTITFQSEKVANYHLYGSFTTETIKEALDALKIGFRFNYKIEGQNITIAK